MKEREIFDIALSIADPRELASFLDEACGTDAEQRKRLEEMLDAQRRLGSFLEQPAAPQPPTIDQTPTESPGTVIGPYKLLQEIGQGGMGVVFMAEQHQPVKRRVALKIIKPGMDSRQVIARFEAERQALSLMDHPNIAKVLDAGTTSTGRPYFVMELVKGQPITKYCDEHHMTPRQRLELLLPVCQAIQHAHQKGIIHRDIKPSNILVAEYDSKPVPKVIDFGVAKAIHQPLTDKTMFTGFGNVVGTLEYMSPEQAKVNQLDIDTRSDIYSLGVLMYELLTGSTPFDRKRLKQAAWDEMLRIIREEEPQRPSTRISTTDELPSIAVNRGTEPKKLSSQVHGELDWIVMKALDKDRNRRYETANGFAMDLQRYLANEAVTACPPSAGYRFRKFAQRNKGVLITASLVSIALVLGTVVSIWQAVRATSAEALAENRLEAETEARKEAMENFRKARRVVDRMLSHVAVHRLADTPHMEPLRTAFLDDAVIFYQEFVQTKSNDPELLMDLGIAWTNLAYVQDWLSEFPKARESLDRAIAIFDRLQTVIPESVKLLEARLDVYYIGSQLSIFRPKPDYPTAERQLNQYDVLIRKVLQAEPDDLNSHFHQYIYYYHLGGLKLRTNKLNEAENSYRQAINLAQELNKRFPGAELIVDRRVQSSLSLAQFYMSQSQFEKAIPILRNALPECQSLINMKTSSSRLFYFRTLQREALSQLGVALHKTGSSKESLQVFRRAKVVAESLASDFPNTPSHRDATAGINQMIGEVLRTVDNLKNTLDSNQELHNYYQELLKTYQERTEVEPDNEMYMEQLGTFLLAQLRPYYYWRGQLKEHEETCIKALAIFEKLSKINNAHSWHYWGRLGEARTWLGKNNEALIALNKSIELKSDEFTTWYWRGDTYTNLKQHDKAIQDYTRVIEIEPKYVWALRNRALNYTKLNQWDKAVADYLKAISLEPGIVQFHTELADAQLKLGKTDEAISTYQKIMEKCPQDHNIPHQLGVMLLQAGRKAEAQIAFRRAVELLDTLVTGKPEMRDTLGHNLRYLVACLDTKTHAKEQEQLLRKAVEQFKTISKSAESASKSNFLLYEGDTLRMLGDTLQQQNRQEEAKAAYRKAITCFSLIHVDALDESITDVAWRRSTIETTFKELHQLLRTSSKQSEVTKVCEEAIRLFEKWSAERPDEKYFKVALEKWRKDLENLTTITSLQQAVALDPENPVKLRNLGIHYDKQANLPEALKTFQKVIELEPDKALNHINLGIILRKLKKPQEAIAAFRKVIELDPKNTQAHHALAETLMNTKDQAGAIAAYRKVLELDPKNAGAMNNLAWILLTAVDVKQRNPQEALTLSSKAVELTKNNWVNLDTHSVAAFRNGQWKESLDSREKMIKLRQPRTEDKFFLAMCYWKLDRQDEARKYFTEAHTEYAKLPKPDNWLTEIKQEAEVLLGNTSPTSSVK